MEFEAERFYRKAAESARDASTRKLLMDLAEIEAQGWSLNPGRYVGVAPGEDVSDEDFKEQLDLSPFVDQIVLLHESNETPTAVHAAQYARIVERKAVLRGLIGAAGRCPTIR